MPSDFFRNLKDSDSQGVLILVLMECPLTVPTKTEKKAIEVLILVLMECPLTGDAGAEWADFDCLNPCSNGMPSDMVVVSNMIFCGLS